MYEINWEDRGYRNDYSGLSRVSRPTVKSKESEFVTFSPFSQKKSEKSSRNT